MSVSRNNIKVEERRISNVPISAVATCNLGDMVKWDDTNKVVTPMTDADEGSEESAWYFCGVVQDQQPIASLGGALPLNRTNIVDRGLVEFYADDNATYYPGDWVCIGSDPQKVKKTGASVWNGIGIVAMENGWAVSGGAAVGKTAVKGVTKLIIAIRPQWSLGSESGYPFGFWD